MHWHDELTMQLELLVGPGVWLRSKRYTIRGYVSPSVAADHAPFQAVPQASVDEVEHTAFLSGALRIDGEPLGRADWRGLAWLLLRDHGVITALADRHGEQVRLDTRRWARG